MTTTRALLSLAALLGSLALGRRLLAQRNGTVVRDVRGGR